MKRFNLVTLPDFFSDNNTISALPLHFSSYNIKLTDIPRYNYITIKEYIFKYTTCVERIVIKLQQLVLCLVLR